MAQEEAIWPTMCSRWFSFKLSDTAQKVPTKAMLTIDRLFRLVVRYPTYSSSPYTSGAILYRLINLQTHTLFVCGKKLEHLGETVTLRMCKLLTDSP